MAEMTTARAIKTDAQSKSLVTSAWYAKLAYNMRLAGKAMVDNNVEIAVNVTLKAKSALKIELNQLE